MFAIEKRDVSSVNPTVYVPTTETIKVGEALKLSSGKAVKAGATDIVTHVAVGIPAGGVVPCIQVHPTDYFKTTSTATVAPTVVGQAVTLHTDGLSVTATAVGGVFVIDETDGAATNSTVIGHFLCTKTA